MPIEEVVEEAPEVSIPVISSPKVLVPKPNPSTISYAVVELSMSPDVPVIEKEDALPVVNEPILTVNHRE